MENNIYSSPKAELQADHDSDENNVLASRWARLGAALIDGLLIMLITLPLMYFTGAFESMVNGEQPSILYNLGIGAIGIVFFTIIHGRFLIRDGQTIGKKLLGIKIVTADNKLPSLSHLTKRYGFYMVVGNIPVIGPFISLVNILFIFSKSKSCLHDHIGNTQVVQAN